MAFDTPASGDPQADAALTEALRAVRALAAGRFEVLGPLGQDREGEFAFLGREDPAGRLVVLKSKRSGRGSSSLELQVLDRLNASVPPPAGSCPVCKSPFTGWDPTCPDCGADLAGSPGTHLGTSREELLAAVRQVATGYEVLGDMPRARGGANVYFARESAGGTIVALRLEQGSTPGKRSGYTVAATRMMRPKLLYGAVGGEQLESGAASAPGRSPWTPAASPGVPAGPGASAAFGSSSTGGSPAGDRVCPQCGETFGSGLRFCPNDGAALRARAPAEDLIGQVIADRYHILSKLGEGGMGRVYLAEHVRMGRRCAVKVMNPMLLYDPDSVSRFNREAANASRINHPNVAAVYDFGEAGDLVYLAMELVEGESLAAILERERILPEGRAMDIARQVADGLSAAHELGIVHRDLKPDNVMVSRSRSGREVVKVVDFGIAKATRAGRQTVTRTGYVVGTPAYMSPEQILGDAVDFRSDIYSLGCILYEALTGTRAFTDESGEVSIRQRLTEPPPPPRRTNRQLSKQLDAIVVRAMARAPEQRFGSAAELGESLMAAAAEAPGRRSGRGWLPWGRARAASAETEAGAVPPPPPPTPSPFESPPGAAPTAPVPLGWTGVVQPPVYQPPRGTTVLRHRSARPPARHAWLIAAGCGAAVLLAYLGWSLLSPGPVVEVEQAVAPIPVAAPEAPSPPRGDSAPSVGSPDSATPATGSVWFDESLPLDARVLVDGKEVALPASGVLSLSPGPHNVRVTAPGFRAATAATRVVAGETDTLRVRLTPLPSGPAPGPAPAPAPVRAPAVATPAPPPASSGSGSIVVIGNLLPGAEVTLDGEAVPPGQREIPAAPGIHWLRVSALGYRPDSAQIEVTRGSKASWQVPQLTPLPRPEPIYDVAIVTQDTTVQAGGSVQLRATVVSETGGRVDEPVRWESTNPEVAGVDAGGRVIGRDAGRAYVRASTRNDADSIIVTVSARPSAPAGAGGGDAPAVPMAPTAADLAKAVAACTAALGSGNERQIVETYQAKTALDVSNLRKLLDVALKPEAEFAAAEVKRGAAAKVGQNVELPLQLRFTWRNNAGVNKKKDAAYRLGLSRTGAGWKLASCRAEEKVGF